jgi:hypothetical protein
LTAGEVVSYLWRNGSVPVFISTVVHATDREHTYVPLRCSGRFSALKDLNYDHTPDDPRALAPFAVRIPFMPTGWLLKDQSGNPDMERSLKTHGRYEAALEALPPRDRLHPPQSLQNDPPDPGAEATLAEPSHGTRLDE